MKAFIIVTLFSIFCLGKEIQLNPENHIVIQGHINAVSMSRAKAELTTLVTNRGMKFVTLYIVMISAGGSVDAGEDFVRYAKQIPLLETITISSFSMGSHIVNALPGKRWGVKNVSVGFHEGSIYIPESRHTRRSLKDKLLYYEKEFDNFERVNYERMGLTKETYQSLVDGKDWELVGVDAVKYNALDEITDVSCSSELKYMTKQVLIPTFFGLSTIETVLACPI